MSLTTGILWRLLRRLRRHFGANLVCVLRRELGMAAYVPCVRPDLECRVLNEEQTLAAASDPELELDPGWVRAACARGAVCLGAFSGSRLVGYNWLAFGDTPYSAGVWVSIGPVYRYSHKTFVRPECRGQRISQALHLLADRPDLRRGRRFAVNFVNADNDASLAALRRAGSERIGYVAYAECFGTLIAVRSPHVKHAGIRFYKPVGQSFVPAADHAGPTPAA